MQEGCIVCGEYVPEGMMICDKCLKNERYPVIQKSRLNFMAIALGIIALSYIGAGVGVVVAIFIMLF